MVTPSINPMDAAQVAMIQKKMALEASARNGVNWFYWIAGLSLINTVIYIAGGSLNFVVGLGITQVIDGIATGVIENVAANAGIIVRLVGIALDIAIAGAFVLAGFLGRKRHRWIIILGMIFYALDGIIFLGVGVWLAVAFHAFALWGLWGGLRAINALRAMEKQATDSMVISPMP